jgi:tRNA (cytidine/uridine-2'-O-)-methyltransferase
MNIVLVQPEIPPNTGNVARLCAATGATLHLVGPLGFRLDDKTLKRAGMDYWEEVRWHYWESFDQLHDHATSKVTGEVAAKDELRRMKDEIDSCSSSSSSSNPQIQARRPMLPTFYYATTKATRLYTEPRYKWGDFLVFGRETAGLPEELLRANPETTITIPMWNPKARSLNLATAVAIVLYEAMRQIKKL